MQKKENGSYTKKRANFSPGTAVLRKQIEEEGSLEDVEYRFTVDRAL